VTMTTLQLVVKIINRRKRNAIVSTRPTPKQKFDIRSDQQELSREAAMADHLQTSQYRIQITQLMISEPKFPLSEN